MAKCGRSVVLALEGVKTVKQASHEMWGSAGLKMLIHTHFLCFTPTQ